MSQLMNGTYGKVCAVFLVKPFLLVVPDFQLVLVLQFFLHNLVILCLQEVPYLLQKELYVSIKIPLILERGICMAVVMDFCPIVGHKSWKQNPDTFDTLHLPSTLIVTLLSYVLQKHPALSNWFGVNLLWRQFLTVLFKKLHCSRFSILFLSNTSKYFKNKITKPPERQSITRELKTIWLMLFFFF